MDEYTVNTVKVSKMFLGFLIFAVSLNVDNTCDPQNQLPYWVYAISLHMGLLTLLDTFLIFVTNTKVKKSKCHILYIFTSWGLQVYIFSHHFQGSVDFDIVNTYCPIGVHPQEWINDERIAVHYSQVKLGCTSPSTPLISHQIKVQ